MSIYQNSEYYKHYFPQLDDGSLTAFEADDESAYLPTNDDYDELIARYGCKTDKEYLGELDKYGNSITYYKHFRSAGKYFENLKTKSMNLALMLRETAWGSRYFSELESCASTLIGLKTADGKYKVQPHYRCKKKWCLICNAMLVKKRISHFYHNAPALIEKHDCAGFAMLTLTVKNCNLARLNLTIADMKKAFRLLYRRKHLPEAWVRALEVTYSLDTSYTNGVSCHPHFHVLLALPKSYLASKEKRIIKRGRPKKGEKREPKSNKNRPYTYKTQKEWQQLWKQVLKVRYNPIVDIRMVYSKSGSYDKTFLENPPPNVSSETLKIFTGALGGVRETLKYVMKPQDFEKLPKEKALLILHNFIKVRNVRYFDCGGWFKDAFKKPENPEVLESKPRYIVAVFRYIFYYKKYFERKDRKIVGYDYHHLYSNLYLP